jgi:hypothetical protein
VNSVSELHQLPKLRDIQNLNAQQLKHIKWDFVQAIEYAKLSVGITQDLNETRAILWEFCVENYKDFAPEEIKKAFDLYNAKKLTELKISHFNAFSNSYLGEILDLYRKYRRREINRQIKQDNKVEEKPTKEKLKTIRKEYCKTIVTLVKYYRERKQWKFDGQMALQLVNEISRLKFIDWTNYMTDGKINDDINSLALKEIQNRIKAKEQELDKRFEIKKLREKLDLYISGASVQEIESQKRSIIAELVLKDYLDNHYKSFENFIDFFSNELG